MAMYPEATRQLDLQLGASESHTRVSTDFLFKIELNLVVVVRVAFGKSSAI